MAETATLSAPPSVPSSFWLNRLSPQTVFILVAGFFGLAMVFAIPPIQVPDEPAHWFRVYQLSQGKVFADRLYQVEGQQKLIPIKKYKPGNGKIIIEKFGGQGPVSIRKVIGDFGGIAFNSAAKTSLDRVRGEFARPLNPRTTHFEEFPSGAQYTPIAYFPQSLAMMIARKLDWPAVSLLYAGRVGTLLGYLLVGFFSIRILPILKWPACFILTSPMALFLSASLSADPMTTAFCFLAIAVALRCICSPVKLTPGRIVGLALAMFAVAMCKPAYFPIAFLVFAIPPSRWGGRWHGWFRWALISSTIVLLCVGSVSIWSSLAGASEVVERGVGPKVQTPWILHHPAEYLNVLRLSVTTYWPNLTQSAVGLLGWVDTPLQPAVIDFIYIVLIWLTLAYDQPLPLKIWPRLIAAVALLASIFLIFTATYLIWCGPESPVVEGLQGRYFIPIALLACMIFRRKGCYAARPAWMLAMLSAISAYTLWVVVERYYLPPGSLWKLLSGTSPHT